MNTTFCLTLKTDKININKQVFLKITHKDSNKFYPLMVAHHRILDSSIIMHQIIHSFEIETS